MLPIPETTWQSCGPLSFSTSANLQSLSHTCCNPNPVHSVISVTHAPFGLSIHLPLSHVKAKWHPGGMTKPLEFPSTRNFQKRLIISNQVSYLLFHSLVGKSASPSNAYQQPVVSHLKCHYYFLYHNILIVDAVTYCTYLLQLQIHSNY